MNSEIIENIWVWDRFKWYNELAKSSIGNFDWENGLKIIQDEIYENNFGKYKGNLKSISLECKDVIVSQLNSDKIEREGFKTGESGELKSVAGFDLKTWLNDNLENCKKGIENKLLIESVDAPIINSYNQDYYINVKLKDNNIKSLSLKITNAIKDGWFYEGDLNAFIKENKNYQFKIYSNEQKSFISKFDANNFNPEFLNSEMPIWPAGIYVYYVTIMDNNGNEEKATGKFTVFSESETEQIPFDPSEFDYKLQFKLSAFALLDLFAKDSIFKWDGEKWILEQRGYYYPSSLQNEHDKGLETLYDYYKGGSRTDQVVLLCDDKEFDYEMTDLDKFKEWATTTVSENCESNLGESTNQVVSLEVNPASGGNVKGKVKVVGKPVEIIPNERVTISFYPQTVAVINATTVNSVNICNVNSNQEKSNCNIVYSSSSNNWFSWPEDTPVSGDTCFINVETTDEDSVIITPETEPIELSNNQASDTLQIQKIEVTDTSGTPLADTSVSITCGEDTAMLVTDNWGGMDLDFNKKIIVIDPGHGGTELGATAFDGTYEKDYTLSYALSLKEFLENMGFIVYLTRETDIDLGLQERINFAKNHNADILLSIHFNSGTNIQSNGIEALYCDSQSVNECNPDSVNCAKICATSILNKLDYLFRIRDNNGLKPVNNLKVVKSEIPSLILEIGFLSNQEDLNKIKNEKAQIISFIADSLYFDCFKQSCQDLIS